SRPGPGPANLMELRGPAGQEKSRQSLFVVDAQQAQLPRNAVDRPGQLLAAPLGGAAELGGDGGPVPAVGPEVRQLPFLLRQPFAELAEQLLEGDQLARAVPAGKHALVFGPDGPDAAHVAALTLLVLHLLGQ